MSWFRENRFFVIVFFIALVVRLVFLPGFHEIWWDSGVYIGMGKYLWSFGSAGVWEHIRPVFWPVFLGFLWFIRLSPVFFGRLLEFLLSLGSIILFYLLAEHYFGRRSAIFSTVIFAFSSIFLYLGFHLYTEIPAVFLVLLSIFLFEREKYFSAGLVVGLAFITKFPAALFVLPFLIVLCLRFEFRNLCRAVFGFAVPAGIFMFFNFFMYSHPLLPLVDARLNILTALGCNVLRARPWWFYFAMLFRESWFHLFAVPGLYLFFRKYRFRQLLPFLCLLLPFVYFVQLNCRDYRYLFVFLPFVAMFSGSGIVSIFKRKRHFILLLSIILCFSVFKGAWFVIENEVRSTDSASQGYFEFLDDKVPLGEVWTSNPIIAVYSGALLKKIYYATYDGATANSFLNYLAANDYKIQYVFMDNCGGGIICHPADVRCMIQRAETFEYLDANFDTVYDMSYGRCFYKIYENPLFL